MFDFKLAEPFRYYCIDQNTKRTNTYDCKAIEVQVPRVFHIKDLTGSIRGALADVRSQNVLNYMISLGKEENRESSVSHDSLKDFFEKVAKLIDANSIKRIDLDHKLDLLLHDMLTCECDNSLFHKESHTISQKSTLLLDRENSFYIAKEQISSMVATDYYRLLDEVKKNYFLASLSMDKVL